jgi:putative DNA primase/helicase
VSTAGTVHKLGILAKEADVEEIGTCESLSPTMDYTDLIIQSACRTVAGAKPELKLKVFMLQARDLMGFVRRGKADEGRIGDALQEIAESNDLIDICGREEIETIISEAATGPTEVNCHSDQGKPRNSSSILQFDCMADVESNAVEWIWPGRIARGKLTLVAGDPGIGKSQMSIDSTARITKGGMWPDGGRAVIGSIVILSAEDSTKDTLRPRLEAAGADLNRVFALRAVVAADKQRTFNLQADLDALGDNINAIGDVAVVIIDPITSYMGKIDSHRTTDVRSVLEPLAAFAERFNVAILAITHPPKAIQNKALHAVTGSLAFVAAARLVFIVVEEPDTTSGRRLLLSVKNNLGLPAAGLGFHIEQRTVSKGITASLVAWDSAPVAITADQALAVPSVGTTAHALHAAKAFLLDELATGPLPPKDIRARAEAAGIAWRTVRRAQQKLGIKPHKAGLNEGWLWNLPNEPKFEDGHN